MVDVSVTARRPHRAFALLHTLPQIFDPSHVPGLGGGGAAATNHHIQQRLGGGNNNNNQNSNLPPEPSSPFFGHHGPLQSPGPAATFPDSPSFYPGMVFSVPVAATTPPPPDDAPPPPAAQPDARDATPTRHNHPPPPPPPQQQRRNAAGRSKLNRVSKAEPSPPPSARPQPDPPPPAKGRGKHAPAAAAAGDAEGGVKAGGKSPLVSDKHRERDEQEARQAAYRRELEEQIRVRKQVQAQEEEAARRREPHGVVAGPPAWPDGGTRQLPPPPMPMHGAPQNQGVTRRNQVQLTVELPQDPLAPPQPPIMHLHHPPPPQQQQGPWPPPPPPPAHHTLFPPQQTWNGPPQLPPPPWPAGPPGGAFGPQGGPLPPPPGPHGGPTLVNTWTGPPLLGPNHALGPHMLQQGPPVPGGVLSPPSPGAQQPYSPTGASQYSPNGMGGGRRFMAAMAQLKAGPSEEQQHHMQAQRAQLLRDLDEQVRQKKEREMRRKADEAAQHAKVCPP